jgi:electron-transferring-flavoprotein dehydrogenase
MSVQREQLEADVLIVGAGPAGLSCALQLANLINKHNESGARPELSAENIYVLEKGREIGAHQLSGAIMNPKALAELVPDFAKSAPLDMAVTDSAALLFTEGSSFRFPITPPPFQNKGNYVISLNKLVKWLGGLVEAAGVNVFKEFGGAELVYEGQGVAGVITEDKGLDKNGKPKDNYTPGYELRAKVTVLAEGTRGSLTKKLVAEKKLDNINPQSSGIGIKELWDVQPGRIKPLRRAYAGLASFDGHVRRRLDLRPLQQSRVHRVSRRARICGANVRSAHRFSKVEDTSFCEESSRGR